MKTGVVYTVNGSGFSKKERGAHSVRIKSLLIAHGIRLELNSSFLSHLEHLKSASDYELGEDLKSGIVTGIPALPIDCRTSQGAGKTTATACRTGFERRHATGQSA